MWHLLFGGDLADAAQGLAVLLLRAVGEVQAKQVDPGADEPPQHRLIRGSPAPGSP